MSVISRERVAMDHLENGSICISNGLSQKLPLVNPTHTDLSIPNKEWLEVSNSNTMICCLHQLISITALQYEARDNSPPWRRRGKSEKGHERSEKKSRQDDTPDCSWTRDTGRFNTDNWEFRHTASNLHSNKSFWTWTPTSSDIVGAGYTNSRHLWGLIMAACMAADGL